MDSSTLPPSSPTSTVSLSPTAARHPLLDPYAAISGSQATAPWRPPNFAKREREPESPNASPGNHKRPRRGEVEFPAASSSPFGSSQYPINSSPGPFVTPPRYVVAVPRSPRKETAHERQERVWATMISSVMDSDHETILDLSDKGMTFISPEIESLSKLVRLTAFGSSSPSVSRAASLPTNQPGIAPPSLQRVSTTAISLRNHAKSGVTPIELFLSGNQISLLPTELFRVENLTALSLRNNRLKVIPSAIGALKNLKELTIGGNEIRYLPAEIDKLPLTQLNLHPNKWLECPDATSADHRVLSPLTTEFLVPSLRELCIRTLLSFSPGSSEPWVEEMDMQISGVPDHYLKYFSATCRNQARIDPVVTPLLETSLMLDPFAPRKPREENDPKYDLSYSVCPNKEHGIGVKRSFMEPAETRYCWVRKIGSADTGGLVPLLYRGCGPGCLDFLEDRLVDEGEEDPGDDDDLVF